MGEVHLATHVTVRNKVAVKFLLPPPAEVEGYRERFLAEARIGVTLWEPLRASPMSRREVNDPLLAKLGAKRPSFCRTQD